MNVTLNNESKPYEDTKNRINSLLHSFNKFIVNNHQPDAQETQQIINSWKMFEQKITHRSPEKNVSLSPSQKTMPRSPDKSYIKAKE